MSQQRTIRFGLIGTGMIAHFHARAMQGTGDPNIRLVGAADVREDAAKGFCAEYGAGLVCADYHDLLASPEVDAVGICTPSGQHAEQAIAAMRAGKHVLVEKPMALNLDDADLMIRTAKENGVALGVVFQSRFEPPFPNVRQAIEAGDLGALRMGAVTMPYFRPQSYFDQASWRGTWALDGGGVLMNQGIHWMDQLVWLMGDPVEIVARADTIDRKIEVEDLLTVIMRFANGAMATLTATTTAAPGFPQRIEVYGTQGGVQIEGKTICRWDLVDASEAALGRRNSPDVPWASAEAPKAGAAADPKAIPVTGHIAVYRDFVAAIRDGRAPAVDGAEGRRSLAAVVGVYRAAGLLE